MKSESGSSFAIASQPFITKIISEKKVLPMAVLVASIAYFTIAASFYFEL